MSSSNLFAVSNWARYARLVSFAALGAIALSFGPALMPASAEEDGDAGPEYAMQSALAAESLLLDATYANGRLIAVGEFGHIVLSDDRGATWRQAESVPTQATLTGVTFVGEEVGFAVGHADLIEGLERLKNSFNSYPLDRMAIAGAVASVEDEPHFRESCRRVIATREQLSTDLAALGFEVLPSAANFVFARHPRHDAGELALALRNRAILVRHFKAPRIDQFLRITVGTDSQCGQLVRVLGELLG